MEEYDVNKLLNSAPSDSQELDVNSLLNSAAFRHLNQPDSIQWKDVPLTAARNFPSSAIKMGGELVNAISHPIDTAQSLIDIPAGFLQRQFPNTIGRLANATTPNVAARSNATYDQLLNTYKQRYGTEEGFKEAIATDPASVLADLATVVAPVSSGLKTAGVRLPSSVGKAVSSAIAFPAGLGGESVARAYSSGVKNAPFGAGVADESFIQNLKGNVPMQNVLDTAKQNLQNLKIQKNAEYRSGMSNITTDKSVLDFSNIDQALNDAQKMTTFKGQIKNPDAYKVFQEMQDQVNNWKKLNPNEYHTPEGFDALKQTLGDMAQRIPYEQKTARMVAKQIYDKTKTTINDQAPTYGKVMADYSEASDLITEMEKAFSLGNKASADTALRKLQSLTRNNVNTNYGNRLDLASQLEKGGAPFLDALAGQSMQSFTPRGLAGVGGLGTLGASYLANPSALVLLPFQSPRILGSAAYRAGQVTGGASNVLDKVPLSRTQGTALMNLLPQVNRQQIQQ